MCDVLSVAPRRHWDCVGPVPTVPFQPVYAVTCPIAAPTSQKPLQGAMLQRARLSEKIRESRPRSHKRAVLESQARALVNLIFSAKP